MYSTFMAIAAILLILLLVVGIHEGAHALSAWYFGIKIKRISIGFGTPLLKRKDKSGCEWVFALWPLGGYVQMLNTRIEPVDEKDYPLCFDKKPVWIRICVLLAGSVANLIFAFFALILVFSAGLDEPVSLISTITPGSAADKAGIASGDKILEISGKPAASWREAGTRLIMATHQPEVPVLIMNERGLTSTHILDMRLSKSTQKTPSFLGNLGIVPDKNAPMMTLKSGSFLQACQMSLQFIGDTIVFMLTVLWLLITKTLPFSLLIGPLGLFSLTIATFFEGLIAFIFFTAGFSIAVGFINLFPVPGLDGGSILYALVEKCRGKPVSVAMEVLLHRLSVIVAALILVQLLLNDVLNLLLHNTRH